MSCANNFELLCCVFPGGYSYTNKKVYEYGDYKKVAFLDYYGCLRFNVPVSYIPDNALLRIEHDADAMRANFRKEWDKKTEIEKLSRLGDLCGLRAWVDMDRSYSIGEQIDYLEYAVFGWLPHSGKVAEAIQKNNVVPIMKAVKYFKE